MGSPLLALPGEIRNLIYEHAVVHDREIPIRLVFDHRTNTAKPSAPATQSPPLALVGACRTLHNEAVLYYYSENRFSFPFSIDGVALLQFFLSKLKPEFRDALRHIVFRAPNIHIQCQGPRPFRRDLLGNWQPVIEQLVLIADSLPKAKVEVCGNFSFDLMRGLRPVPVGHYTLRLDIHDLDRSTREAIEEAVHRCEDLVEGGSRQHSLFPLVRRMRGLRTSLGLQ